MSLDITILESIKNLEPNFVVTEILPNGKNRHKKPIYIDALHNWCVLDVSTPTHKMKYTIIDLSDLETISDFAWKYTPYVNKKTGTTNEYVQTVKYLPKPICKSICTTLNRVILFGFGSKSELVADHTRQNKLDNRRIALQICTHAENLKNAERRPWEALGKVNSIKVRTPLGDFESFSDAAKAHGITVQAISQRMKRANSKGWELL